MSVENLREWMMKNDTSFQFLSSRDQNFRSEWHPLFKVTVSCKFGMEEVRTSSLEMNEQPLRNDAHGEIEVAQKREQLLFRYLMRLVKRMCDSTNALEFLGWEGCFHFHRI